MKSFRFVLLATALVSLHPWSARSATVTWDGGGGDFSWQTPANWSGDALPGTNDTAVINIGGSATVTSSTDVAILNLQCSNHFALSGGTFLVQSGTSVVQGQFSVSGYATLAASGGGTKFTVVGAISADTAQFNAINGATLSLPKFYSYTAGFNCFTLSWLATVGGTLDFPGLTNLVGNSCASLSVQALTGGGVWLTNLANIADGNLSFLADGTNSLVDLRSFSNAMTAVRGISLEARNGGTNWVPQFKRGATVSVTLKPNATLPVAQIELLGTATVQSRTATFSALTNINGGSFSLSDGAVVTAPNLRNYDKGPSCFGASWVVVGTNSLLDLPGMTNFTGGLCVALHVQAWSGGQVNLSNVVSATDGLLAFLADGTNSVVNLSAVLRSPGAVRTLSFEVRNAGTMLIPALTGGTTVTVTLKSGGTLPVAQLTELSGITVDAMTVDFPVLTNFNAGNLSVSGGGGVTIPNLKTYDKGASCGFNSWMVSGAGSSLRLAGLTNITGGTCTYLGVQASGGASVILTNVISVSDGQAFFTADGAGSVVNLTRLQQFPGTLRTIKFEASATGTMLVPLVTGGPTIEVTLRTGGVMAVGQMTQLAAITVEAMPVDFPLLTAFDTGSITVTGGGVVTAPNLKNYTKGPFCTTPQWSVSGAGSILRLAGLTNITGGTCTFVLVQAFTGGNVILTNVVSVTEGLASFLADGIGSVVNLSRLQQSPGTARTVALEARNFGTIVVPNFQGGETLTVVIKSGGVLDTAQLHLLKSMTVSATTVSVPGITNLFAGDLIVESGAVLSLPNLTNHNQGGLCITTTWTVDGAGSVLNLPGLIRLTGGTCVPLTIQALNGGQAVLSGLTHIPAGKVHFFSSGSGSLVNLLSLSNFVTYPHASELTVTNNGSIQLNREGLILAGVAIKTLAGNGTPPAVNLTNINRTLLFGRPWHSYWVDQRSTSSPTNPWTFYQRVPLTNDFQTIAPSAAVSTEFYVREFVANPQLLDISVRTGPNVQLVLYAPTNQSFTIQATTNLAPANWTTLTSVTMTNTFRILPEIPVTTPQRYFRAVPF